MPMHGPGKNGHREYRTPDGRWRLLRTTRPIRWRVDRRAGDAWSTLSAFAKRRDARLFLEETIAQAHV